MATKIYVRTYVVYTYISVSSKVFNFLTYKIRLDEKTAPTLNLHSLTHSNALSYVGGSLKEGRCKLEILIVACYFRDKH